MDLSAVAPWVNYYLISNLHCIFWIKYKPMHLPSHIHPINPQFYQHTPNSHILLLIIIQIINNMTETAPFVFDPSKFLLIVLAAIFASSLSELISYFLLYRKEDYRINKSNTLTMQPRSRN
jgi:hypothetical protein